MRSLRLLRRKRRAHRRHNSRHRRRDESRWKKTYEPVTYDGAGHGFMRAGETPDDTNPPIKKPAKTPGSAGKRSSRNNLSGELLHRNELRNFRHTSQRPLGPAVVFLRKSVYNAAAWRSHDRILPTLPRSSSLHFFFLLSAHAQKPSSAVADTPLILKHVTVC